MHTMLPGERRGAGILSCLLGLGLTGCMLPVPTVPLNLPAHGHTYKVRDRDNNPPAGEGILIVHTYYNNGMERLDCYPICNGQAVVPFTLDMRVTPVEMFGSISWCVPTWYLFLINAHHAHAYPVMPGLTYWEDSCYPKISEDRFIYGLEPRPEVLRLYPSNPYMERDMLLVIEQEVQKYFAVAERSRKDGWEPREDLHNEQQAKLIVKYIHARLEALESGPASRPGEATPPASQS